MKPGLAVIDGGDVGLATALGWAKHGHHVVLIEPSDVRFHELMESSFFSPEQEIKSLFERVRKQGFLEITQDLTSLTSMEFVFLCVEGSSSQLWSMIERISCQLRDDAGLIIRNTPSIGTTDGVQAWFQQRNQGIEVISWPEFLQEGKFIEEIQRPNRIVLGGDTDRPKIVTLRRMLAAYYSPILVTTRKSAEVIRYTSHAFLATKLSFMNEMARLCEGFGVDVVTIARGMGMDPRIGQTFLEAGIGFGRSSLAGALSTLIAHGEEQQIEVNLLETVRKVDQQQGEWMLIRLIERVGNIAGKRMAVWGITTLSILEKLLSQGVEMKIYDPFRIPFLLQEWDRAASQWRICEDALDAVEQADVLLIFGDQQEFKEVDLVAVKKRMRSPLIIDGRNLYPPSMVVELGFEYISVGRKI